MQTFSSVFFLCSAVGLMACSQRCVRMVVDPQDASRPTFYRLDSPLAFTPTSSKNEVGSTTVFYDVNGWRFERMYVEAGDAMHCERQSDDQHGWRATVWRGTDLNDPCLGTPYLQDCSSPPAGAPTGQAVFTFAGEEDTVVVIRLPEAP